MLIVFPSRAPFSAFVSHAPCFVQVRTCMLWGAWSNAQSHALCKTYCMMTTSTANRLGGNCWWASTNRESSKIIRAQKGCNTMETAMGCLGRISHPSGTLCKCFLFYFPPSPRLHEWIHLFQPRKTLNANSVKILDACLNGKWYSNEGVKLACLHLLDRLTRWKCLALLSKWSVMQPISRTFCTTTMVISQVYHTYKIFEDTC